MIKLLQQGLSHPSGLVRKGSAALLEIPKWLRSRSTTSDQLAATPPVLVNSFPKSGTHLLVQLAEGLPDRVNYGAFLASMTSSFRFRERSAESTCRFIRGFVPGEIVRGHLFFDSRHVDELAQRNTVHYFIYRDPRAVVVSEAHYLREMNPWHRLGPYFRKLASIDEAIKVSIRGLDPSVPGIDYPNIAQRFSRYQGWLACPDCFCIKFEDLQSEERDEVVRKMATFYSRHGGGADSNLNEIVLAMTANVAPLKSHTFRSGKKAGWRKEFTAEHRRLFNEEAGDLLIELGYERDHSWVDEPMAVAE